MQYHLQYICSTCGRHICIDKKGELRARCFMPFSRFENAVLYLKCAEILSKEVCGIYEIQDQKTGRKSYKIYAQKEDLVKYLKNNPGKSCSSLQPMYISIKYTPVKDEQIRKLSNEEVDVYLKEQRGEVSI